MAIVQEYRERATSRDSDRRYVGRFTDYLLSGQTVSSGTAFHTPPSGAANSVSGTVSGDDVLITVSGTLIPNPGVPHLLDIVATFSNGEDKAIRLHIHVPF